jgi:hypothetical protein
MYSTLGNCLGITQLTLTLLYAIAVVGHAVSWWNLDLFGTNWDHDGFCLSFKSTIFHTHLLCLYSDTIFAVVLFILSKYTDNRRELDDVRKNVISVFFHGIAHGFLWYLEVYGHESNEHVIHNLGYVVLVPFYFSFLHIMTSSPLWVSIIQTVVHTVATASVPHILVFTYVNTVITFNLTLDKFLTSPRDVFFVLRGLLIGLPIISATFIEPILCDTFLINWGGHLLFDASIPLSVILYFIVAKQVSPRDHVLTEETKKLN